MRESIDDILRVLKQLFDNSKGLKGKATLAAAEARKVLAEPELIELSLHSGGKFSPKVWNDNKNGVAYLILYHDVHNAIVAIKYLHDGSIAGISDVDGYHNNAKALNIKPVTSLAEIVAEAKGMVKALKWVDETPQAKTPVGFRVRRMLRYFGR